MFRNVVVFTVLCAICIPAVVISQGNPEDFCRRAGHFLETGKLDEAIRVLNKIFNELKLGKHPDKTNVGRIEKGFDFLGYHSSPQGLSLGEKTVENFLEKARRISAVESRNSGRSHIGEYVKTWHRWTRSGLSAVPIDRKRYLEIVGKGPWAVRNHVHRFDKSRSPVTCTVPVGSPDLSSMPQRCGVGPEALRKIFSSDPKNRRYDSIFAPACTIAVSFKNSQESVCDSY